jgi:hypothetical protein
MLLGGEMGCIPILEVQMRPASVFVRDCPDPRHRRQGRTGVGAQGLHRLEHRIGAHVLLSWLALLLIRTAESVGTRFRT